MPTTRGSALRHQRQDEHKEEDGDVTLTEETSSDANSVVEAAAVGSASVQPSGLPLPTEQFLATLMETITRAQAEANKALIGAFLAAPRGDQNSGASSPSAPATGASSSFANGLTGPSSPAGNFTRCSARFDGSSHDAEVLEAFLDAVEVFKECASVSDQHALRGLPMLLTGDAAVWWRGVRGNVSTWADARLRLRAMYGAPRPAYKVFREVFAREQGAEQSDRFISEKRALLARLPYRLAEEVQVDITYGLLDRRIRKRVPRESIIDMDHLLERARIAEDHMREVKPQQASASHKPNVKATPAAAPRDVLPKPAPADATPSASGSHSKRTRCNFCRKFGHSVEECRNSEKSRSGKTDANSDAKTVRCYGCGKIGVVRSKCDVCNADSNKKATDFNVVYVDNVKHISHLTKSLDIEISSDVENRYPNIEISSDVENRYPNIEISPDTENRPPDGDVKDRTPSVEISSDKSPVVKNRTPHVENRPTAVANDSSDILGDTDTEAKSKMETSIAHACSAVAYRSASHPLVNISIMGRSGVAIIDTGATHCIASPALYKILLDSGVEFREMECRIRLADGSRVERKLLEAEVLVTLEGRKVPADFLVLPGDETRTLLGVEFLSRAGMVVDVARGKWTFSDEPDRPHDFVREYPVSSSDAELMRAESVKLDLREDEGPKLTDQQRSTLNEFIDRRSAQFAHKGPATDFATHHIKVSADQEPIASPPYRLSQNRKEALQKELEKLLRDDVIEECESPWASNVVLVAKKDGSWRLCIDYRKLNAVTEPDRYPLPRIEDILHAAKTSEYMTTLDLRAGYHQVNVSPEDQDKTTFTTPLGTYRYKRMPMGLRNSGATFQRLIDRFKSNLKGIELLAYLDDLVLLSPGPFERHLADLEVVFDRLEMFKLRVNREKSHFARDSVKFLGHVIVPGGIQVDPDKTAAIEGMAVPQNVKHLKCFLQTSSWFRRFIPSYAEVARPLTSLLKKESSWKWEDKQQKAFEHIKALLVSAPILRQADEMKPFILCTDSSGYCLGAVLMQGEGPDERPIEYASRLLTSAERNYSTTEREALAVVWAVSKFRGYIDGAKIKVRTDHQPLRWLMSQRSPSGRLARWALTLQEFDLDIGYTPGRSNVVADTLSRPVCSQDPDCDMCLTIVDMPRRSSSEVRENQRNDPEVRKIIDDLEADEPSRGRPWSDRGYTMSDGILYRYSLEADDGEDACLVVPEHERAKVMADLHDAPTAGHLGVERTICRIRKRYYWPGMRSYVTNHIKDCVPCQRYKADNRKPAGLLQTPAVSRRFEVVSVDLFGPLIGTPKKNRWILIVEDVCSRWVELFPLESATSTECAQTLTNEVFLRYGVPRRLISDNGVQFVSEVMQQVCHTLGITQSLTPYYHPEANPIERKNRDLKPQLAMLVGQDHATWDLHLASVRFAMNSAVTSSTGFSPSYLTFGRELRTPCDSATDMRAIIENDNFIPGITPYLKKIAATLDEARDTHEKAQEVQKRNADKGRRTPPEYQVGDLVLLKTQGQNDVGRGQSAKFIPRRDGPYRIRQIVSPTTFILESVQTRDGVGKYHVSHLTPFAGVVESPIREKRKRGRPRRLIAEC